MLLTSGVTVIMTTHEQEDAAHCDTSTSMADGDVVGA
jgi:ABC-type lipoprotein export system ATPase subunit